MSIAVQPTIVLDHVRAGWIGGHLQIGFDRHSLLASWLLDTPALLVQAAIDAVDGQRATVVWIKEPGCSVWPLEPEAHALRMTIAAYDSLTPPTGWVPDHGEDYVIAPRAFGWTALAAMEGLEVEVSAERYADKSHWGMPFPADGLRTLRTRLR